MKQLLNEMPHRRTKRRSYWYRVRESRDISHMEPEQMEFEF